jgi:hypothetical protein
MIDFTGIPSSSCPNCNSPRFLTWIVLDPDDYEIGMYATDGSCVDCGTRYTLATPEDHPDMLEEEIQIEEELRRLKGEENDEY